MMEQKCCIAASVLIIVFAALTIFGILNAEHDTCHRTDTFALLDKLLAVTTLFIIAPLLIALLVAQRYSCLLPLARFLLYFYFVVSIFRLGALTGTSGASFEGCPTVCIFSVICILLSGCLICGVTYVVEERQEMQRMNYWTDSSI